MTDPNVVEDLLAHQEEASSQNRLLALEKKVQLQADEILCLKSSLADVIRRLQTVEAHHHADSKNKAIQKQTSLSKQPPPSPRQSLPSRQMSSNSNSNLVENGGGSTTSKPIPSRSNPKLSVASITSLKSTGGGQIQGTRGGSESSSNGGHHGALPQFIKDQGLVKLYLRGRPINFYLPNDLADVFDPHTVVKPPKDITLKLEWVYGYRGKDCRSNIYQLQTGESVYFVAAVAILFNSEERSQRHYLGHTDDIKSIAIHPDRIRVATGQCTGHDKQEGRAHVRIWDSVTLVTLKTLGLSHSGGGGSDLFQNSICCLAFSRTDNGEHLACVDEAGERTLSVWRWETETRQSHTKCYGDAVLCLDWHPSEPNTLVSAGKQHLIVWTFDPATNLLSRKTGTFENVVAEKPKFILSLVFNIHTGELISGDSDGNLILWSTKEAKAHRLISGAHEGGVFSLLVVDDGKKVITGGKDFRLVEWDSVSWEKTGRVLELPDNHGSCRCLAPDQGNFFLVGTTKNSIYKANFDLHYIESVVQGHSDELWGLCTAPLAAATSTSFITCGNDSVLSVWDTLSHSRVQAQSVPDKLHCVHSHPIVENLVAVGCQTNKPKWFVYDLAERKMIFSQVETGQESVECIQYSPDGKLLAVGCRDNHIYIYQVTEHGQKYSRVGKCSGHSSFVTHLDWSTNSEYLMSNSGDYEILYWQVSPSGVGCKQATNHPVLRDLEWQNIGGCTLAPSVLGIWTGVAASGGATAAAQHGGPSSSSQSMDGTDINAVAVSKLRGLCAYVDDFGKVNLTAYPCVGFKVEKFTYRGHSSHVTNVHFVNNDTRLVTTGGNDMSIFQWTIVTP